jgi:hypothetical protein
MKIHAWMLCCLGLLAPLQVAGADEPPQGFVKITLGIEAEGLEKIPVVGTLLKHCVAGMEEPSTKEVELLPGPSPELRPASSYANVPVAAAVECPVCARVEQAVPRLSALPYVGRLFRNVGLAPVTTDCEVVDVDCPPARTAYEFRFVGPDGLERIGVDVDCDETKVCAPCQATRYAPPAAVCAAPVGQFDGPICQMLPVEMAAQLQTHSFIGRDELLEALMEARVEAAVAQTALKVREESNAEQVELIKELVSSQIENAKLTAKLELAAEKEKMLAELYEARVELTALQAHAARDNEVVQRKRQRKNTEARRSVEAVDAVR